MVSAPKIGVVTVTYNSAKVLDDFLSSVFAQTFTNFELYVIDNASADSTLTRLSQCSDLRLQVVANPDNRGVAAGNNQGIALAQTAGCTHVLFLNNDTVFEPKLFEELLSGATQHSAALTTPKIYFYDAPNMLWYAGGAIVPSRGYAAMHTGLRQDDRGQFDKAIFVDYAPTCCLLAAMRVFESIGIMDERYFCYWDDTDFCFRAKKASIPILYYPVATLTHKESSLTQGSSSPFATHYGSRNRAYYIRKNVPSAIQPFAVAYCRFRFFTRFITRQDDASTYKSRLKSFAEGLTM